MSSELHSKLSKMATEKGIKTNNLLNPNHFKTEILKNSFECKYYSKTTTETKLA